jgi:hypothetical protein
MAGIGGPERNSELQNGPEKHRIGTAVTIFLIFFAKS